MIDVHTHLHPPRLAAAIRRWFSEHSTWKLEHPSEPPAVAELLRANGVERFVFCSYAHRTGMAAGLNAWLVATSRALRGYGLPLATIHPDDPEYCKDFDIALADGCIGLKIHEDVQRVQITDARFDPIFERLGGRGFVLAHVGPIPWRTEAEAPNRVERVLQRNPDLRLVVAHMGGENTAEYFALMARYPNLYLDTTMALAMDSPMRVTIDPQEIETHAKRILHGTDFPNIPYAYDGERRALDAMGLTDRAREAILRENALELIG